MADGELSDPRQRTTAETNGAQVDRRPLLSATRLAGGAGTGHSDYRSLRGPPQGMTGADASSRGVMLARARGDPCHCSNHRPTPSGRSPLLVLRPGVFMSYPIW